MRGLDDAWTIGGALRLEDFEDFGTTTTGKLSGRYRLTGAVALRTSASRGFRAPTPGQQHAFNVSTEYDHVLMDLVNNGTIPSTSRVAELRGGAPLHPERSVHYALGAVVDTGPFSLTADYFRIRLADRLALTQLFALTPAEVDGLLTEGVTSARNLQNFRFFTNHFETRTQGLDLVATYAPPGLGGRTTFGVLVNHTDTDVTRFDPEVLDGSGSARRPPDRRCARPCASGGRGCRRGGRRAGYQGRGVPVVGPARRRWVARSGESAPPTSSSGRARAG